MTVYNIKTLSFWLFPSLLFLAFITSIYDHLNGLNSIAIILLGVTWIAQGNWRGKIYKLLQNRSSLVFILFYFLYLLGNLYSSNRQDTAEVDLITLPFMALPLILGSTSSIPTFQVRWILIAFAINCFLVSFLSLFKGIQFYLIAGSVEQLFYHKLASHFIDSGAIYFSIFMALANFIFAFIVVFNWLRLSTFYKVIGIFLFFYSFAFMLLLNVRTSIVSLLFIYIAIFIGYFYKKKLLWVGFLIAFVFLSLITSLVLSIDVLRFKFKEAFDTTERIQVKDSVDHSLGRSWGGRALRVAIWECAWDVVKAHPLLGVGSGDVQDALQKSYKDNNFLFAADYNRLNAHNQFLETQIALGLPGLIVLLAMFGINIRHALLHKQYVFLAFTVFIFLNCLTESVLRRQKGVILFTLVSSAFLFHVKKESDLFNLYDHPGTPTHG